MSRRGLREKTFRLLFRMEFHDEEEFLDQKDLFFGDEEQLEMTEEDVSFVMDICDKITEKLPQIDERISEKTTGWSIERIGKAELAILRLAVYEIMFDDSIPTSVTINEAVELAKKYGSNDTSSFVNGVLAKFV
ncbi:MAG: transcription antitermination factor NusB [Lachnospiraceae bacterium]|nr:transcription antitermination factor NusB [Lachnospiraceae bacterium]